MIGSLTIEKASYNISYMFASLKILSDAGGELSRTDFIGRMASFMGVSPVLPDGKENRTPYNKTKFDRYFGFIDIKPDGGLLLTPRGQQVVQFVIENRGAEPDNLYALNPLFREKAQELFLDSCCFDSFGSYNCGAEASNSDIEPPRVILKSLQALGEMTELELGYVLWGLDAGEFDSYDLALQKVLSNRGDPSCDYQAVITSWGKFNFLTDFKIVDLFKDENIGLIEKTGQGYRISETLSEEFKHRIMRMKPISAPIQTFVDSCYSQADTMRWIRNAVLGRFADQSAIFKCEFGAGVAQCKQMLANAINAAYSKRRFGAVSAKGAGVKHQNATVTFIMTGLAGGKADMDALFSGFASSFARKNDFKANDHGWTEQPGQDHELYDFLIKGDSFAKQFGQDKIVLPANLNLIGVK